MKVLERLNNPSSKYRSTPFWAWNDRLESDRLIEQLDQMKEQGSGGFFIHSREGLETPYLSKTWMTHVEDVIAHAQRSGLECWIYDEDTWPSGSAGGSVSAQDPQSYSARALTAELLTDPTSDSIGQVFRDPQVLAVYRIVRDETGTAAVKFELTGFNRLDTDGQKKPEYLIFRNEISHVSEWYNNSAPTDNLNPEAVGVFIKKTHELYAQRFKESFGGTIKGFFTDEPNICDFFSHFTPGRPWLPWTTQMPAAFEKSSGYSILKILPLLFLKGDHMEKARYDFWLTLTRLFLSSYTKQLYQWCEEHNVKLTGHMLYENDLGYATRCNGAVMPHYRYMHSPGIDLLGDQREEYLTVKQCTSVANQFRKEMVVSEMYGCTGWDFSFAGQKRVGDWQYVMGVTRRCQHLSLYSITGCRKRDYPPAFSYQNTWWKYSHVIEDYFARLGVCTTSGIVHRKILMIHPTGTFWMRSHSSLNEDLSRIYMNMGWLEKNLTELNKAGDYYNRLAEKILKKQFDFDFGDELIMSESGRIVGDQIQVGSHCYSYVIVPPLETLMETTCTLLRTFLDRGGIVFWMKPFPERIDAVKNNSIDDLISHRNVHPLEDARHLIADLEQEVIRPVIICDRFNTGLDGFLSMTRQIESAQIISIVNTNEFAIPDVDLVFSTTGRLSQYDLMKGTVSHVPVRVDKTGVSESGMRISVSFGREETRIYFIEHDEEPTVEDSTKRAYHHPHEGKLLVYGFPSICPVSLTKENTLTLDRCSYRIKKEPWSDELPVWKAQQKIRERAHMRPVYYNGALQRYLWIDEDEHFDVTLRFRFTIDSLPLEPMFAVVEKSGRMDIRCNGVPCDPPDSWFIDRDFLTHRIVSARIGENSIEIQLSYTNSTELEDIYVIGVFGVSPDRHIMSCPTVLRRGDWTLQGLLHYGGSCCYRYIVPPLSASQSGRRLYLSLGDFKGSLAIIRIEEEDSVYVFQPSVILVDHLLRRDADTRIEIEIVGNFRNLLGPLHRSADTCCRISWEDFHPADVSYSHDYSIEPMGLMGETYICEIPD
ncbi:MAG: glycosyl hydrolase [Sphaerochaetaceae bacterium]